MVNTLEELCIANLGVAIFNVGASILRVMIVSFTAHAKNSGENRTEMWTCD